jgi:cytochrome o ubiquinol oxidase subunit 1
VDYYVEVEEIKAIEAERRALLEEAKKNSVKDSESKDDLEVTYAN